jgi:hypothetical protein
MGCSSIYESHLFEKVNGIFEKNHKDQLLKIQYIYRMEKQLTFQFSPNN